VSSRRRIHVSEEAVAATEGVILKYVYTIITYCVQVKAMSSRAVTARLRKELLKEIEEVAKEESVDRSSAIQRLLKIGLKEYKMEKALNLYRDGKVTLWKAAELAGVSLREMMEAIKARDIPYQFDLEALEEYVKELLSKRKNS